MVFSPCSDIGQQQFVLANGQINNSTQTILKEDIRQQMLIQIMVLDIMEETVR